MATKELYNQLKFEEGLRLKAYRCSEGFLTIGIGHNLDAQPVFNGKRIPHAIDEQMAYLLFEHDMAYTIAEVKHSLPWLYLLNQARQDAIFNMAFQMGVGSLMEFKNSLKYLRMGAYVQAGKNLKKSLWYKQTPERASRVISQIVAGAYYSVPK